MQCSVMIQCSVFTVKQESAGSDLVLNVQRSVVMSVVRVNSGDRDCYLGIKV